MSWEQELVNAQVDVNRAVFEMNRPGMPEPFKREIDKNYLKDRILDAIKSLNNAIVKLNEDN